MPPGATFGTLGVFCTRTSARPVAARVATTWLRLVGPWVVVMTPGGRMFTRLPTAVGVTLTFSSHRAPAAMVPPESPSAVAPTGALTMPVQPTPVSPAFGGFATTSPSGKTSVRLTPVRLMVPVLVLTIVIVIVEATPGSTARGENDFPSVRKASVRVMVAEAALALVTPSAVVTALAAMVLVACAELPDGTDVGTVTFTWI